MRILVISLLRLGDIIIQEPLLRGLLEKHPHCQIEMLINDQFMKVQSVSPSVSRWHGFPRQHFQSLLAGPAADHWQAFEELQKYFSDSHWSEFDVIYNFTNNFLSAHLMDFLQAQQKFGSRFEDGVKVPPQNLWEDYLNHHLSQNQASRFTLLEIYSHAFSIPLKSVEPERQTKRDNESESSIFFQVLTSDTKKNWGLDRFRELKNKVENYYSQKNPLLNEKVSVKIFCSSEEKARVQEFFHPVDIEVLNLVDLKNRLASAKYLVTGDTSVQHLAAQVGCPIVSLFMGSADANKTKPFTQDLRLVKASTDCYPCNHSDPCSQSRHLCADSISVDEVFSILTSESLSEPVALQKSYTEASETIESFIWRTYLNQEVAPEDLPMEIQRIRPEYLKLYIVRAQNFHSQVAEVEANGRSLEVWSLLKKSVGREFRDSFAKMDRRYFEKSELRAVIKIRKRYLTGIINQLRNQNGTKWSSRSEGTFAEA